MDLQKFTLKAKRKKKELGEFLDKLDVIVPADMPELVAEADGRVWQKISCTECAHCCKTMTPTFTDEDMTRIADHLDISVTDFQQQWLKKDDGGDWVNTTQPCQFLEDNKCTIYEVRPLDCAEFPHHHKKPFDEYYETFKNNLVNCPATLELVSRLHKVVVRDYEW